MPGTQLFLAGDESVSGLAAKRKWWHAAQQLWVRRTPRHERTSPPPHCMPCAVLTWHAARSPPSSKVVRISDEAQADADELNLAMFYVYSEAPMLLGFESRDEATRCRWLLRSIGFGADDVLPVPVQVRPSRARCVSCADARAAHRPSASRCRARKACRCSRCARASWT